MAGSRVRAQGRAVRARAECFVFILKIERVLRANAKSHDSKSHFMFYYELV